MIINAGITLYHKSYDPKTREDTWTATPYENAAWYGAQAVMVDAEGLQAASSYTVRIFTTQAVKAKPGDVVIHGLSCVATPLEARKHADESFTVTHVQDNRRGSPRMFHWKLAGK